MAKLFYIYYYHNGVKDKKNTQTQSTLTGPICHSTPNKGTTADTPTKEKLGTRAQASPPPSPVPERDTPPNGQAMNTKRQRDSTDSFTGKKNKNNERGRRVR